MGRLQPAPPQYNRGDLLCWGETPHLFIPVQHDDDIRAPCRRTFRQFEHEKPAVTRDVEVAGAAGEEVVALEELNGSAPFRRILAGDSDLHDRVPRAVEQRLAIAGPDRIPPAGDGDLPVLPRRIRKRSDEHLRLPR